MNMLALSKQTQYRLHVMQPWQKRKWF